MAFTSPHAANLTGISCRIIILTEIIYTQSVQKHTKLHPSCLALPFWCIAHLAHYSVMSSHCMWLQGMSACVQVLLPGPGADEAGGWPGAGCCQVVGGKGGWAVAPQHPDLGGVQGRPVCCQNSAL